MAEKFSQDKIQLEVVINGSPARKELAETTNALKILQSQYNAVRREEQKIRDEREKYRKGSTEWVKYQEQLIAVRKRLDEYKQKIGETEAKQKTLQDSIGTTGLNLNELKNRAIGLRKTLASGLLDNEAAIRNARVLAEVEKQMARVGTAAGRAMLIWEEDRKAIDLQSMSLEQLSMEMKRWEEIKRTSKGDSSEFLEAEAAIARVKERTEQLTNEKRRAAAQWEKERQSIALNAMTLDQLAMEEERYRAIINSPTTSAADRAKAAQDLALVKDRTEQLANANRIAQDAWEEQRKSIALVDMTLEQLGMEEERYRRIIANPATGAAERAEAARGLDAVKNRLEQLTSTTRIAADEFMRMRGSMRIEDMSIDQLKLLKAELERVNKTLPQTSADLDKVEKELLEVDKALEKATSETARQDRQWEKMRQGLKLTDMSMEQLEQESRRLKTAMAALNPTTEAAQLAKLRTELQAVETRSASLRSGLGPLGRAWASVKTQVMGATAVLGSFLAGGAIISSLRNLVTGSAKMSDEMANIRKATGLTEAEVRKLNKELQQIQTRTTGSALREIAVGLGQVGEAASKANVQAIDQIVVALGDEFGEDARTITTALSQLRNNLSDIKSGNYAEDVTHIGNALNVLGASGLATAPVVTDIANRISGVARSLGVSSGQIFGVAAAFQELGVNTERGSTAYIKTLQKMAAEPAKFGAVVRAAGGDAQAFTELLNTDIQAALLVFAQAVRKAGASNTEFAGILKELDTDGAGVSELLSKLGTNYQLVEQKSEQATKALQDNASVLNEFRIKNENLAGQLAQLGKEISKLFVNDTMIQWVTKAVAVTRELVDWLRKSKDEIIFLAKVLANAVVAWTTYRVVQMLVNKEGRIYIATTRALAVAKALLTGQINLATAATRAFNAAQKVSPWGFLISMITTATTLFLSFREEVSAAADEQQRFNEKLEEAKRIQQGMQNIDDRMKVLDKLSAEQLDALKRDIEQELALESDRHAKTLAAETAHAADIEDVHRSRATAIKNIEGFLAGELSEEDRKMYEKRLAMYKDAEDERLAVAEITGSTRTAIEIDENKKQLDSYLKLVEDMIKAGGKTGGGGGMLTKEQEKAVDKMDDLREEMLKIRRQMELDGMSSDEREIAQLDDKYGELRKKILANTMHTAEDVKALDLLHEQDRVNLIERQGSERAKKHAEAEEKARKAIQDAQDQIYMDLLAAGSQQAEAVVEGYDKLIERAQGRGKEVKVLEQQRYEALLDVAMKHYEAEVVAEMQKWDDIIALAEQAGIDTTQLEEQRNAAILAIGARRRKAETEAEFEHRVRMKVNMVKQLQDFAMVARGVGSMTQGITQYMEAMADADGKRTRAEQERIKQWGLITIAVQGAAAIASGIASAMELPWPANLAAAASSVGTVIGLIAQAKAMMNSVGATGDAGDQGQRPTPTDYPRGKKGGTVEKDQTFTPSGKSQSGVLEGPSHEDDGLKVYNPKTGEVVAEFEGGEAYMLMSKAFTDANRDQIGTLLEASRKGLRLQISDKPPAAPNPAKVTRAMSIAHFADGGISGGGTITFAKGQGAADGSGNGVTFVAGTGLSDNGGSNEIPLWAQRLMDSNDAVREDLKKFPRTLKAETVLKQDRRARDAYDRLRDSNRVKRA